MQKLNWHRGAPMTLAAAALLVLVGPASFATPPVYKFGLSNDVNNDPMNGNAEGNAAVLRTEAGIIDQSVSSLSNTLFTDAAKKATSPSTFNAETYQQQQPLFAIDAYLAAIGKKPEISPIVILSTTAAAKKAQLDYVGTTEAIEPAARLLQVLGGVEVTAVFAKNDGQLDVVDAKVKELAAQGVFVLGAVSDDGATQGDKRVVMAGDDAWTKARAKMLGGSNLLLADDEATSDFDINGTNGKLATSGLGAARTQKAVFA